jgi:hypothetical protein
MQFYSFEAQLLWTDYGEWILQSYRGFYCHKKIILYNISIIFLAMD